MSQVLRARGLRQSLARSLCVARQTKRLDDLTSFRPRISVARGVATNRRSQTPCGSLVIRDVYHYCNTHMPDIPFQFEIHPSSGVPIYRQVMDQVKALASSGRLRPGDMLPSVRQMAVELQINMMTVSKAYARMEAEGVLERARGQGMLIAEA